MSSEARNAVPDALATAAPDLLAVCRQLHILSLVIDSAIRRGDPQYRDEIAQLIVANRDAIAKAEGRL